jgi:hypothetical protein
MTDTPKALFGALLKAQAQMGGLVPDSTNPHLKNKYASLAAVLDVVQEPLRNAGLVLYQSATYADGAVMVMSSLVHPESGEIVQEQLPIPLAQQTAQAIGGAITYGRRYLAMAMCGLAPDDDDDGNTASQQRQQPAQQKPQAQAVARYPSPPVAKEGVSNGASAPKFKGVNDALLWAVEQKAFADKDAASAEYLKLRKEHTPKTPAEMWEVWFKAIEQLTKEKAA